MPTVYGLPNTAWFTLLSPKIEVFLEYLNANIVGNSA